MDKITRKELKSDKFAQEVELGVEYVTGHRQQMMIYGGIAALIVVVALLVFGYRRHQATARQEVFTAALEIQQAAIGPQESPFVKSYATEQERSAAASKAFRDVASRYPSSDEGQMSKYYLGALSAEQGNQAEAVKWLQDVAENGSDRYASLAKLLLADLYVNDGKIDEADKLLRSLMKNPTEFVSQEQATIALAQVLAKKNPAEARKLLDPLKMNTRGTVSQAALTILSQLPPSK